MGAVLKAGKPVKRNLWYSDCGSESIELIDRFKVNFEEGRSMDVAGLDMKSRMKERE